MKLEIKKFGINGEGIAYDHKLPVFVSGALPEEVVEARVKSSGRFKTGEVVKVLECSKARVDVACPYYKSCGACSLMHADYDLQLACKKSVLEESLLKYAGIEADVEVLANESPFGYRNELKLPFGYLKGELCTGLYSASSNRFVPIEDCLVHDPLLERMRKDILRVLNRHGLKVYERESRKGLRFLILRVIEGVGQCCLVTGNDSLSGELLYDLKSVEGLVSLFQSVNTSRDAGDLFGKNVACLFGKKHLQVTFDGLKIDLSMRSFFQLNTAQTYRLYKKAIDLIPEGNQLIVEAYCGVGIMSLLASGKAKKVVGIEYINDAVANASNNARKNKIDNCSFVTGDSAEVISRMFRKETIDYLIVDPPRSGLDDAMLETLLKAKIRNIVYVSCSPSSLAKNLAVLTKRFKVKSIEGVDMFSQTALVESVVLLSK